MSEPDTPAAPDDPPTAQQSIDPTPGEESTVSAAEEPAGPGTSADAPSAQAVEPLTAATPAVEPATPAGQQPTMPAVEPATPAGQQPTMPAVEQAGVPAAPRQLSPAEVEPDTVGLLDERPEIAVGAAFAGGFLLALILKRLGR